jgi:hypothetical protein
MLGAALLMAATGLGFAGLTSFWPLLLVAFLGTLNPGSGDVSVFLPLEHARLAQVGEGRDRTRIFARYSLVGVLCAAAWRAWPPACRTCSPKPASTGLKPCAACSSSMPVSA